MSRYDGYRAIEVQVKGGVALATLNRPERLNAVDRRMHEELARLFPDLAEDGAVNAACVTGAGRAFCAGADFKASPEASIVAGGWEAVRREAERIVAGILACEKPLVAAVRGPAVGLGATLALLCDVVYAAEDARFGDPHVRIGLVPGDGGALIWPLLVGPNRAKELLMTGDLLDAREGERLGLVNHVVSGETLLDQALGMARRLAEGPRLAVRGAKKSVNRLLARACGEVFPLSLRLEGESYLSADHREAVRALREGRSPRFGEP